MNSDIFKNDPLRLVLNLAYDQAMKGKGRERHADGKDFLDQAWNKIAKVAGIGFLLGQALKKIDESKRMIIEAAVRELLGAIVYIAMAIIHLLDLPIEVKK